MWSLVRVLQPCVETIDPNLAVCLGGRAVKNQGGTAISRGLKVIPWGVGEGY